MASKNPTTVRFGGAKVSPSPSKLPPSGTKAPSVTYNKRPLPTKKA
jgi:hypothetical protein